MAAPGRPTRTSSPTIAGISKVVVPNTASGHSAYGSVTADRQRKFSLRSGCTPRRASSAPPITSKPEALNDGFAALEKRVPRRARRRRQIRRFVGMRFRQQVHEIGVEVPAKDAEGRRTWTSWSTVRGSSTSASTARTRRCASPASSSPCCGSRARRRCTGRSPRRPRRTPASRSRSVAAASISTAPASSTRRSTAPRISARATRSTGPAIIERPDTTIVVGPGQRAEVEPYGNIIIDLVPRR